MGWNTSALFVEKHALHEVLRVLPDVYQYLVTGSVVPAEAAWCGGGHDGFLYGLTEAGWCQLWDPDRLFAPRMEKVLAEAGPFGRGAIAGATMLAVSFESLHGRHGFSLWREDRLVRYASYEGRECVSQGGDALAIEATPEFASERDEDRVWAIITELTGFPCDDDACYVELAIVP